MPPTLTWTIITYLSSTKSVLHKLPHIIISVVVTNLLFEVVQENQHLLQT